MRIAHLTSVHVPHDSRILLRECRSLAEMGYEVILVAPGDAEGEDFGVEIRTVRASGSRIERFAQGGRRVLAAALKIRADLFHIHDPELIPLAVLLRTTGAKVVYDAHEDLPKQVLEKDWIPTRCLRRVVSAISGGVETSLVRLFDGVVAVSREIADRFSAVRVEVVHNFPPLDLIDAIEPMAVEEVESENDDAVRVIYPGALSRNRGIKNVIDAVGMVGGDLTLHLVGPWSSEKFRRECQGSSGWQHVRYGGVIHPLDVFRLVKLADMGVHLPLNTPNYSSGLSVKCFEYMASGLPFVVSDEPAKRERFGEYALLADPDSPQDIARAIAELASNDALRRELGTRGRMAAKRMYNWETEARRLDELYREILSVP